MPFLFDAGRRFGVVAVDIDGKTIPNFLDLGYAGGLACLDFTVLDLARSVGDVDHVLTDALTKLLLRVNRSPLVKWKWGKGESRFFHDC